MYQRSISEKAEVEPSRMTAHVQIWILVIVHLLQTQVAKRRPPGKQEGEFREDQCAKLAGARIRSRTTPAANPLASTETSCDRESESRKHETVKARNEDQGASPE
jgi:hypothetical protein